MRPEFSEGLSEYNAAFQAQEAGDATEGATERELAKLEHGMARQEQTTISAQKEIVALQEEKRAAMELLHRRLAAADNPEAKETQMPGVKFAKYDNGMFIVKVGERQIPLTFGDVMTDVEWGSRYVLDPKTTPRNMRKQYALSLARYDIADMTDLQIMINEQTSHANDGGLKKIYSNLEDERKSGELSFGHIAEKMVRALLAKISIDHPDFGFRVERTDVDLDAHAIDFKIHVSPKARGVMVETRPRTRDAGIQFTIKDGAALLAEKQQRIDQAKKSGEIDLEKEHIDDVLLVSIPLHEFAPAYDKWKARKIPGGPDQFWKPETKQHVLRNMLKGLLSEEELLERVRQLMPQTPTEIREPNRLAA